MKILEWVGDHPVLAVVLFILLDGFVWDVIRAVKGCP